MERLVNVHPVLGGALDEGGLQLLRHVFAVSSGDLQTVGLFRRDERRGLAHTRTQKNFDAKFCIHGVVWS